MPDRIYLDWNATAPLRREAREAMAAAWDLDGNPSSVHAEGRHARRLVEEARAGVARAAGALPRNVVFTSGGTEANALALTPGLRRDSGLPVERLLVSAIEHASVLAGGRFPAQAIGTVGVAGSGLLDLDRLRALLQSGPPALVSVMLANNETGAVQPVAEAAEIVHAAGGLLHVDAIQAFGKISFDINGLNADLITVSGHKIGGPKGVGAVVLAEGVRGLEPLLRGGGQELGRRAGTENVAGIAGFGAAVKAAMDSLRNDAVRFENLRNRLETGLRQTPGAIVFAGDVPRLPNTTLFTVPGMRAETAVIGFGPNMAQGAVRLSLGWSTSQAEIDRCLEAWRKLTDTLLKELRRNTA